METLVHTNYLKTIVLASQELSLAKDIDAVMQIVKRVARSIAGSDGVTFVLREGDMCHYVDEEAISPLWKGQKFPLHTCISGWVIQNKKAAIIEDIYKDERVPINAYKPTFVKSLVMVPIRTTDPLGAIGNYWAENHVPTSEQVNLLEALAHLTATSIENIKIYNELERRVNERTNELQVVNKELESFSYSVSHDLRAPLRAISGYLDILSEDYGSELNDNAKHLIANVKTSAKNMNNLIEGLLQFSRMGKKELVRSRISMHDLVTRIVNSQKEFEKDRSIEITINHLDDIDADETLLEQVWINYISNAIKYTSKKQNAIIEIGCEEKPDQVLYYVRDNGVGFDMTYSSKLFGVFQRLHSQSDFKGTGVGLATAQRIIIKHGGSVWAEGKINEGASFYFSLPKSK